MEQHSIIKTIGEIVDPILVYQMGKVGSSSVCKSLEHAGIPNTIFHVHQLSDKGIKRKEDWLRHHNALDIPWMLEDLQYIKKLKELIETKRSKFQWKIITMTREPISVELSAFFENIEVYGHEVFDPLKKINIDKTIDYINRNIIGLCDVEKNYYCTWFDEELKEVFGIDVYTVPYDFVRGYSIIMKDNVSVLLMRLEDMGRSFRQALADFLKVPDIELIRENTANSKEYWNEYRTVLEKISIPAESFDVIYSSRYARHFYPAEEREKSRERWVSVNKKSANLYNGGK
jgi:hypothetical protein